MVGFSTMLKIAVGEMPGVAVSLAMKGTGCNPAHPTNTRRRRRASDTRQNKREMASKMSIRVN
jgi:hypothetical protein